MVDINSYNQGKDIGFAEGKAAPRHGEGLYNRLQLENEILSLKKRLAGLLAVKDLLKDAISEIAPGHRLVSPAKDNPHLLEAYRAAAAKITTAGQQI
jgi:hypothetical protein